MTWRGWTLIGVIALVVAAGVAYALLAPGPARRRAPAEPSATDVSAWLASPPPRPFVMVRSLIPDDTHGRVGIVGLDRPDGPRFISPITCERVYFAADRGVCLTIGFEGITTIYTAEIFDGAFQPIGRVRLTGLPSRVRVAPNGRRAGITVFETGHSYAESGYSTRTTIVDTDTATVMGDLEKFTVTKDGKRFSAIDFNFWGVTFARDSNRFYATLASAGVKYLVEGNVDRRTARVIARDVECPSLSPDNTRVAYKKAFTDARGIGWHLSVLDLATLTETPLAAEMRSVDDQVEWLDDGHVMYHLTGTGGADIWVLATSGNESPRVLVPQAYSPAVVRMESEK